MYEKRHALQCITISFFIYLTHFHHLPHFPFFPCFAFLHHLHLLTQSDLYDEHAWQITATAKTRSASIPWEPAPQLALGIIQRWHPPRRNPQKPVAFA
jgi:hypothetical protein